MALRWNPAKIRWNDPRYSYNGRPLRSQILDLTPLKREKAPLVDRKEEKESLVKP